MGDKVVYIAIEGSDPRTEDQYDLEMELDLLFHPTVLL